MIQTILNLWKENRTFSINFTKTNTKLCLSLHCNVCGSYLFVNGKEIFIFNTDNKNVNFATQFCLESVSNSLSNIESREVSLNGNVFDFSVDYNSLDKSSILNTHKYLMTQINIK